MHKNNITINFNTSIELTFNIQNFTTFVLNYLNVNIEYLEISFIDDQAMIHLHSDHLNDPTTTDIMTFNLNTEENPFGDIYICVDEAKRNAYNLNSCINFELKTLIIHGILHLIGYNDTTKKEKKVMFDKQDEVLDYYEAHEL